MRLKMLLDTVRKWWKAEHGTVSMLDLIMAKAQVKLCRGLISILFLVKEATLKIQSAAYGIRYRAEEIIDRRTTEREPVVVQWTVGNVAPLTAGPGLTIGNLMPPKNLISFNNKESKPVLIITNDGEVEWHGKPSEAADALVRTFQFTVENEKGVTKAARRRYYLRACRNILNKAEKMEKEEFIAFLQKQVYNKERRVIMDTLKGEE